MKDHFLNAFVAFDEHFRPFKIVSVNTFELLLTRGSFVRTRHHDKIKMYI